MQLGLIEVGALGDRWPDDPRSRTVTVRLVFANNRIRQRSVRRRVAGLAGLASVVGVLAACGSSTLPEAATFDGEWRVVELVTDQGPVDLDTTSIVVSIITTEAAVSAETGCNRVLGSYTLVESTDGRGEASFTMPGVGTAACEPADEARQNALIQTMEGIDHWQLEGEHLVFTQESEASQPASSVRLTLAPLR